MTKKFLRKLMSKKVLVGGSSTRRSLAIFIAALTTFSPVSGAHAKPIYVYRDGKAITFSSRPPPTGIEAKVFTGRSAGFSIVKGYGPNSNFGFGARLFQTSHFDKYIKEASTEFGVDKALIRAVIHAESGFNPRAISPKGAQGLMQLMPTTARRYGIRRAFEPRENIRGGTRHLAGLIRRYRGNLTNTIAAYNAGEGAVEQYGGVPPYAETQQYVRRVLALQTRYKNTLRG